MHCLSIIIYRTEQNKREREKRRGKKGKKGKKGKEKESFLSIHQTS